MVARHASHASSRRSRDMSSRALLRNRSIAQFAIYALGQAAIPVISFLLLPLYSKRLVPEEFGIYGLILVLVNVLVMIDGFGLTNSFSIRFFKVDHQQAVNYVYDVLLLFLGLTALTFVAFLPGRKWILGLFNLEIGNDVLGKVFLTVLLTLFSSFLTNELRMRQKAMFFIAINISQAVIFLSCNVYFLVYLRQGYVAFLNSKIVSLGVTAALGVVYLLRTYRICEYRLRTDDVRVLARIGLPLVPHAILMMVITSSDRLIITHVLNTSAVGIFVMASNLGRTFGTFFQTPFFDTLTPILLKKYSIGEAEYREGMSRYWMVLLVSSYAVMLMIYVVLDIFYRYFIGQDYWSSSGLVLPIMISTFVWGMGLYLGHTLLAKEITYMSPFITLASGIVSIAGNLLLLPRIGLVGAALSSIACYLMYFLASYAITQRRLHVDYRWIRTIICSAIFALCLVLEVLVLSDIEHITIIKVVIKVGIVMGFCAAMFFINRDLFRRSESQSVVRNNEAE